MTPFLVSVEADEDLQRIYLNSEDVWGEGQARRYVAGLFELFERLGDQPGLGRMRRELGEGIRSFPHRSHLVFYMEWQGELAIVRILHGRMDIEGAFEDFDPIPGLEAARRGPR